MQPDTPLLADRTSKYGAGVTWSGDASPYVGNAWTHKSDGGNVLFADGHVEWVKIFSPPMYQTKNP